jgi:hypothetical protein
MRRQPASRQAALSVIAPRRDEPSLRDKVFAIESAMNAMPQVQVDLEVRHHFSKDVYGRELMIPKGTTLVGKIHKYEQLNILAKGCLSVLVGDEIKRVTAPFIVVSPPGTKRVAYAHEDSVWITVHGTNETDLDRIEERFIAQSEPEYLEFCAAQHKSLEHDPCHG